MRSIAFSLLIAVVVLQAAKAFPRLRHRREAPKHVELSAEGENLREKLKKYVADEMITVIKNTVNSHKQVFEKVLKQADESDVKSDELNKELKKFTELVDKINSIPAEPESEEDLLKLFHALVDSNKLADHYDEIDNPSDEEKLIKRLLEENGVANNTFQLFMDFIKLRTNYETHIQKYFDSISEEDKKKDEKFLEWFNKFKNARSLKKYLDITRHIFDFMDDDDDDDDDDDSDTERKINFFFGKVDRK